MTCKVIADKNKPIRILDCETNNVFSLENKEEALKFCDALNVTLDYVNELIDEKLELKKENEQLKSNIDIRDKGIIELKEENEQLKEENRKLRFENGKLTHDLFWANKMVEELKGDVE